MYTLYKFHFLNGICEINQLFDDILIILPAPVYSMFNNIAQYFCWLYFLLFKWSLGENKRLYPKPQWRYMLSLKAYCGGNRNYILNILIE